SCITSLNQRCTLHHPHSFPTRRSSDLSSLFFLRGNEQIKADRIVAGDIGAFAKLEKTQTGDTLSSKENKIEYKQIKYPKPVLFRSEEHTSELQSRFDLVCRLLLEKKNI